MRCAFLKSRKTSFLYSDHPLARLKLRPRYLGDFCRMNFSADFQSPRKCCSTRKVPSLFNAVLAWMMALGAARRLRSAFARFHAYIHSDNRVEDRRLEWPKNPNRRFVNSFPKRKDRVCSQDLRHFIERGAARLGIDVRIVSADGLGVMADQILRDGIRHACIFQKRRCGVPQ